MGPMYNRYGKYRDNILALQPLKEQIRGEDIFNAFRTVADRFE